MKDNEVILLSIIIPIYNVEQYLPKTLENVLDQSFEEFELILVDDGSTDNSGKICDEFAYNDSRIKVIHQENAGVSAARNTGIKVALGKYIGFVDSDDLIENNMYNIMVNIAEKECADIVQCSHNRLSAVQNIKASGKVRIIDGVTFVRELFDYRGGDYTNQVALWSKIYRRELFSGIHFPDGRTYEDEQETYKLCLKAKKLVLIPDELYHYVMRENSIITGVSAKKVLDKQLALIDRLDYLPKQLPDLTENCATALINYSETILCKMYQAKEKDSLIMAISNLKQCKKIIIPYLNKYERLYLSLLSNNIGRRWVLENNFEPIQKLIRRIKGKNNGKN